MTIRSALTRSNESFVEEQERSWRELERLAMESPDTQPLEPWQTEIPAIAAAAPAAGASAPVIAPIGSQDGEIAEMGGASAVQLQQLLRAVKQKMFLVKNICLLNLSFQGSFGTLAFIGLHARKVFFVDVITQGRCKQIQNILLMVTAQI